MLRSYTQDAQGSTSIFHAFAFAMNPRVFALFSALFMSPAVLSAAEPGKGTVITIASIGGWVLFSSTGLMLRRQRDKNSEEGAKPIDPSEPR